MKWFNRRSYKYERGIARQESIQELPAEAILSMAKRKKILPSSASREFEIKSSEVNILRTIILENGYRDGDPV